ncbi:MAG TPA: arginase family protein [Verrucomicrobiae bacterium]|nr:arginase family protein [Verrucomicrobiae bacterium]
MVQLYNSTVEKISEADIVILGVPDESRSHARRKGTSKGPDIIRIAYNESNFFERDGKIIPISSMQGNTNNKRIFDYGNIKRRDLYDVIYELVSNKKIPIIIGGDHSLTTISLHAIKEVYGKVGLIYFDAHPDFVSSTTNYYGSVLTDSSNFINFDSSLLVGTRSAEQEELINANKVGLEVITPINIVEHGISKVANRIKNKVFDKKCYVSIDLDCIDPAFAPGVSVPSPSGLSSIDLVYLANLAISFGIVGLDIVEFTPDFDINNMTASLAARILLESIASINLT